MVGTMNGQGGGGGRGSEEGSMGAVQSISAPRACLHRRGGCIEVHVTRAETEMTKLLFVCFVFLQRLIAWLISRLGAAEMLRSASSVG